jgi:hypothetical protein
VWYDNKDSGWLLVSTMVNYVKQLSFNCLHVNFVRIVLNSIVMWTDIGMLMFEIHIVYFYSLRPTKSDIFDQVKSNYLKFD